MNPMQEFDEARSRLRGAIGESGNSSEIAGAAEELLDLMDSFMGECQLKTPYAAMFLVNDPLTGAVYRCTHKPPHDVPR